MKKGIHPRYHVLSVKCTCGNQFQTASSLDCNTLNIEMCLLCHPFCTGVLNTEHKVGRGGSFQKKFPDFRLSSGT